MTTNTAYSTRQQKVGSQADYAASYAIFNTAETPNLSPGVASTDGVSLTDDYAANPRFQELQTELRSLLFTEARGTFASGEHTPESEADSTGREVQRSRFPAEHFLQSTGPIPISKNIHYLNIWIRECAPWLDMFDQARNFGLRVPLMARTSPAVLYALLALAARQMERQAGKAMSSQDSLELYSEAISCLTNSLNAYQPDVLVTACILCVLEMMSVRPRDWRRHLQGCAALFGAAEINGFSGGLLQAVFWCYARMDLCAAIIAEGTESTVLPIEKWALLDDTPLPIHNGFPQRDSISRTFIETGRMTPDMHANYAVYLCAKVCDLIARRTQFLEVGAANGCTDALFEVMWVDIWTELQLWYDERPSELLTVKTILSTSGSSHFPQVFFAHYAAISSNQLYHTACILMLEVKPAEAAISGPQTLKLPLWHARRVVGISLANPHRGCLNNAIQPLYVAGKLFSHHEEHKVVCDLLHLIETQSGWGSRWRIKDLESAWGYPRGTFNQA